MLAYGVGKLALKNCNGIDQEKEAFASASSFYAKLETVVRLAKEIADFDAGRIGGVVYRDVDGAAGACTTDALRGTYDEAHDAACDVIAQVEAAGSAVERFLSRFPLPKGALSPRGDILLREFVQASAFFWEAFTRQPLPRSKSGPAVRFIAAAWTDLGFPDRRDLEGAIGAVAERLDQ